MPNRRERYNNQEKYRITRGKQKQRYYSKTAFVYPKRRWTAEEDLRVTAHSIPDSELSEQIQRSVAAIQTRRIRLSQTLIR